MAILRSALLPAVLLVSVSFCFAQNASLHGIDVNDLDRKVQPCDDFYEFANGTWRANNPIPASMTRWSKRWQAGESAKDRLHEILEAAAADKSAPKSHMTFWGACEIGGQKPT
jgi:putative endopeptidase